MDVLDSLRMLGTWERISSLGIDSQPVGDRRRIRLTNQGSILTVVSCATFALGYAIAGSRFVAPMIANLVTVALAFCSIALNGRGAHTAAKIALLLPINVAVVVASMLLGGRVGFVYYYFLFATVAFLLFEDKPWLKWAFALLSAACAVFIRVAASTDDAVLGVTPMVARMLDVISAIAVIGTVMIIVHLFTRDTTVAEARLAEEHARSEKLLLNILPGAISTRLKDQGDAIADGFADVTVLFADLVGFTELSQRLTPEQLVSMLNRIFSAFDDLAAELGLEKIKTIGDCYMVAAGLPEVRPDHAQAMARMALRMRTALERINAEHGYALRIRIGVHTGPVVAGVIGKKKFIYDLWGDTVNTASRMESSGVEQRIQVTKEVHDRLGDAFETEARGTVKVKGKGDMETYWLEREK